ncbi:MAG: hypothetical protein HC865_13975 [Cyanobacteria bacterium RU_5_0]|nr:hypothetical protein [Cyanobacteria bacterium RU_5_0]
MLDKLFENADKVISAAANSNLGFASLIALALSVLACFFFHRSSELIKVSIFTLMLISAGLFIFATGQAEREINTNPIAVSSPTPSPSGTIIPPVPSSPEPPPPIESSVPSSSRSAKELFNIGLQRLSENSSGSISALQESLDKDTNRADAYLLLGRSYLLEFNCEKALESFTQAINATSFYDGYDLSCGFFDQGTVQSVDTVRAFAYYDRGLLSYIYDGDKGKAFEDLRLSEDSIDADREID